MARGRLDGIVIAGGGLAGCFAALALARRRPEVPLLIIEEGETFGGDGFRSFADAELGPEGAELLGAQTLERWPGFYLAFPGFSRKLKIEWAGFFAADLHKAMIEALDPKQYRLRTRVVALREDAVVLDGGEEIRAEGAIDARGAANLASLELLYEARLERDYRFKAPHRVDRPVLIDASVGQAGGLRFMQCVPLSEDRLIVADVCVSERAQSDAEAPVRLDAYLAARGWAKQRMLGETRRVQPLPADGDFAALWRLGGARVAKFGLRGGFVNPATGRTIADAVGTALLLAEQRDFGGGALHALFEEEAMQLWRAREPLRAITATLADARPEDRRALVERIYSLDPGAIARLQTDELGMLDRMRVQKALRA